MPSHSATPQDEMLARALGGLSAPSRIALLRELRTPKTLREIRLGAGVPSSPEEARIMSRQSVKEHLERLQEIGAIVARETERERGTTIEYFLNHQALFALAEELRGLARLRPTEEPSAQTAGRSPSANPPQAKGPRLVLAKGIDEGRVFPLAAEGEWLIGRRRGLAVSLDFDPFVSTENSRIVARGGAFLLETLPGSRNGTLLNFEPVAEGRPAPLANGDLIGAGRSLLLFRM